jgi:peptidoglycan hydrolase-like protein with peptidoglycan-binding domain
LGFAAPVHAETDLGKILSGLAQTLMTQQADQNAYVAAQNLNTVSGYRDYLARFPNGAYRANAEQALARLGVTTHPNMPPLTPGGDVQSAVYTEASIGLSRTQRILIQRQLTALGYSTGGADGLWGANTRRAITRWQTANRLSATGYVTAQQVGLIGQQAGSTVGPGTGGTVAGDDPVEESLLNLTYAERRDVQIRLSRLGYSTGGADGVFGRNTRRALATWQRDEGLRITGYLTADQLRTLRQQSGG